MKRKSTATGLLTLVALVVLGAFAAGSASAESFLWTGPLPGLLLVLATSVQTFSVPGLPTSIVCQHFAGHGFLSNGTKGMSTKEATVTGVYSSCEAPALKAPATVTPATFLLNANGSVAVVERPIVVTIPGANCSLKISNNAANQNLSTLKYLNLPTDVLVDVNIGNITSLTSSLAACGIAAGTEIPGSTYTGLFLASVDGGSLKWDTTP